VPTEYGTRASVSASGLRVRNLLIILLFLLMMREWVQDAYRAGEEYGYQWGYETGLEEGTMDCAIPFVKLSN